MSPRFLRILSDHVIHRIRKSLLMHMDCRVGMDTAMLEIRTNLEPLLEAAEAVDDCYAALCCATHDQVDKADTALQAAVAHYRAVRDKLMARLPGVTP